jgi:hypothetical protein
MMGEMHGHIYNNLLQRPARAHTPCCSLGARSCRGFHNKNSRQQRITYQSDCMICMAWLAAIHS